MGLTIAIDFDLAAEHGVNAAIVYQQVSWWIQHDKAKREAHRPGWFTGSYEALAEVCPFSVDAVRRAMTKLVDAGLMERDKFRANRGDHTMSYRPVDNSVGGASGDFATSDVEPEPSGDFARSGCGEIPRSRSGDFATSTSYGEVETTTEVPPIVPPANPEPSQLELVPSGGTHPAPIDGFDDWWANYPSSKGKQAARKAWTNLGAGHQAQAGHALAHYLAALQTHKARGGTPPVMHASTFLNGRWEDWLHDDQPDPAWPAPKGRYAAHQTDEAKEIANQIAQRVIARRAAR